METPENNNDKKSDWKSWQMNGHRKDSAPKGENFANPEIPEWLQKGMDAFAAKNGELSDGKFFTIDTTHPRFNEIVEMMLKAETLEDIEKTMDLALESGVGRKLRPDAESPSKPRRKPPIRSDGVGPTYRAPEAPKPPRPSVRPEPKIPGTVGGSEVFTHADYLKLVEIRGYLDITGQYGHVKSLNKLLNEYSKHNPNTERHSND